MLVTKPDTVQRYHNSVTITVQGALLDTRAERARTLGLGRFKPKSAENAVLGCIYTTILGSYGIPLVSGSAAARRGRRIPCALIHLPGKFTDGTSNFY